MAYEAKQASIEAEKLKKETLRADENIQKAITKQNNIIEKLQYQLDQVNKDLAVANNEMKNKKIMQTSRIMHPLKSKSASLSLLKIQSNQIQPQAILHKKIAKQTNKSKPK